MVQKKDWETLHSYDELAREVAEKRVLCDWTPLPCNFAPTFKVERDQPTEKYNPKRLPSYTDRMLVRSMPGYRDDLAHAEFTSCPEFISSDHKPIRGLFEITPVPYVQRGGEEGKANPLFSMTFTKIQAKGLPQMDYGTLLEKGKADPYIVFTTDPPAVMAGDNGLERLTSKVKQKVRRERTRLRGGIQYT